MPRPVDASVCVPSRGVSWHEAQIIVSLPGSGVLRFVQTALPELLVRDADVLVFGGDQRRGYRNLDARRSAVTVSVVCFAPAVS